VRWGDDPLGRPLGYPGLSPRTSGVLVEGDFHELQPQPGRRLGEQQVAVASTGEVVPLDRLLGAVGAATIDGRSPVLAIGSNASPAQLLKKFTLVGMSTVVPMTMVTTSGLGRAHSAHVSRAGYVPITPLRAREARSQFFVLWLDPAQVRALDLTEPNYERHPLADAHAPTLESNERLTDVEIYVSRWGHLLSTDGTALEPVPVVASQRELIEGLLSRSPELRDLAGPRAEDFVVRAAASQQLRDEIRRCFERSGWVSADRFEHP